MICMEKLADRQKRSFFVFLWGLDLTKNEEINHTLVRGDWMKKIAVIYKSIYGSTKQYASWIADRLQAPMFDIMDVQESVLMQYDTILFGGGIYAGKINGISFVLRNFENWKEKKLVVFTVGLVDPSYQEAFQGMIDQTFTKEMQNTISFFHFRGSLDYKKLNFMHKSLIGMLRMSSKGQKPKSEEEAMMLDVQAEQIDFVNQDAIAPLIALVEEDAEVVYQ